MTYPCTTGRFAVLTAASPNLFVDLEIFIKSLRNHCKFDLYVVSIGLSEEQKSKISNDSTIIIEPNIQISENLRQNWPQWYKPFYFHMLPEIIDYILWIDVDIVITKSLGPLFTESTKNFFVLNDHFAPETCINGDTLYEKFSIDVVEKNVALNSGVIGCSLHRKEDAIIIDTWIDFTRKISLDRRLLRHIKLYDQGVLLMTMHHLKKTSLIQDIIEWNRPAKRNLYDNDDRLFDNITHDNKNATIVHYAGKPKLSSLIQTNSIEAKNYFNSKRGVLETKRLLFIGLESAGADSVVNAIRESSKIEIYSRCSNDLSDEAYKKFRKLPFNKSKINCVIERFKREDCGIMCESNSNLALFIPEIYKELKRDCSFILMLADPITLVKSRLLNFAISIEDLTKCPGDYQNNYHLNNIDRSRRIRLDSSGLIENIVWETCANIDIIFDNIKMSNIELKVIWQNKKDMVKMLIEVLRSYVDFNKFQRIICFDSKYKHSDEVIKWINDTVCEHSDFISCKILETMLKHNLIPEFV